MSSDTDAYRDLRRDVLALARAHAEHLDDPVPAAPAWRARDVLAHLAGVCDDVATGNMAGVATDPWTAVQVDKRRGWDLDTLLEDWERQSEPVEALIDGAPPGTYRQLLFDAWTHEQDLRGALGAPGGRASAAATCAYEWGTGIVDARDRDGERAGLELINDDGSTVVGTPPVASSVRVSRFDLLRSMTGRRSDAQIRSYGWSGAPDPDRLVLIPVFRPRAEPLEE